MRLYPVLYPCTCELIIMVVTFLGCLAVQSWEMMSIGMGKMMVLLFSAEMLFNVCR